MKIVIFILPNMSNRYSGSFCGKIETSGFSDKDACARIFLIRLSFFLSQSCMPGGSIFFSLGMLFNWVGRMSS